MATLTVRLTVSVISCILLCASFAIASGNSASRRIEEQLRDGTLDTSTALRLQELLWNPPRSPRDIPEDLLASIPDADADCAARLRQFKAARTDTLETFLGTQCYDAVSEYFQPTQILSGSFRASSSSLMDTVPQWKRDLQGLQNIGPVRSQVHWSPDRSSPWVFRQVQFKGASSNLLLGDLQGWSEAHDLWNRPNSKAIPSKDFLAGSGAWINGAQVSVSSDSLEIRSAVHRRDSSLAMIAGLGGFGQFLSIASGQDSGHRWIGSQLQARLQLDNLTLRLQPAWSHAQSVDNRSFRLDASGHANGIDWSSWGSWHDNEFRHPLAVPEYANLLGKQTQYPLRTGGATTDGTDTPVRWHTGVSVVADARDHALLQPSVRLAHAANNMLLEASAKSSWYSRPDTALRNSLQLSQVARNSYGDWTPRISMTQTFDTASTTASVTPGVTWQPWRSWRLDAYLRQSLDDFSRRESSASSRLEPSRAASITTEILYRQGMLRSGEDRWYIRLEGSSRW